MFAFSIRSGRKNPAIDRDLLEAWLEQGRSLTEIGALTGRDPSTVGYWVRKHGLVANGREKYAPRGGLTREDLEPLVDRGLTLAEIAAEVDRSVPTARYWIARHGLNRPCDRRRQDVGQAIREGRRTVVRHCRRHGETEFALVGDRRYPRCKECRAEAVARRRRKVKQILVEEAGGKCVLCTAVSAPFSFTTSRDRPAGHHQVARRHSSGGRQVRPVVLQLSCRSRSWRR